jgi:hypothetical protein
MDLPRRRFFHFCGPLQPERSELRRMTAPRLSHPVSVQRLHPTALQGLHHQALCLRPATATPCTLRPRNSCVPNAGHSKRRGRALASGLGSFPARRQGCPQGRCSSSFRSNFLPWAEAVPGANPSNEVGNCDAARPFGIKSHKLRSSQVRSSLAASVRHSSSPARSAALRHGSGMVVSLRGGSRPKRRYRSSTAS